MILILSMCSCASGVSNELETSSEKTAEMFSLAFGTDGGGTLYDIVEFNASENPRELNALTLVAKKDVALTRLTVAFERQDEVEGLQATVRVDNRTEEEEEPSEPLVVTSTSSEQIDIEISASIAQNGWVVITFSHSIRVYAIFANL